MNVALGICMAVPPKERLGHSKLNCNQLKFVSFCMSGNLLQFSSTYIPVQFVTRHIVTEFCSEDSSLIEVQLSFVGGIDVLVELLTAS